MLSDGTNTYLYGAGRIAQYQTAMQYYGADGLGSVRQLYDASGLVAANMRYEPYGSVLSHYGTATSVYGFTGEQQDAATGLEYLRARYYSSAQGRFFQRDPFNGRVESPGSLHKYLYATDNPVRYTDPTGRDPKCLMWQSTFDVETGEEYWDCQVWDTNLTGQIVKSVVPGLPQDDTVYLNGEWSMAGIAWQEMGPAVGTISEAGIDLTEAGIGFIPGGNAAYNFVLSLTGKDPFRNRPLTEEEKKAYAFSGLAGFAGDLNCFFPFLAGIKPIGKAALGKLTITATRASVFEHNAARWLADRGFEVILRDPVGTRLGGKTSDLLIEKGGKWVTYDVYTPVTDNASRIISEAAKKGKQAQGVVINLERTPVKAADLGDVLARVKGAGSTVQDVIIVGGE